MRESAQLEVLERLALLAQMELDQTIETVHPHPLAQMREVQVDEVAQVDLV